MRRKKRAGGGLLAALENCNEHQIPGLVAHLLLQSLMKLRLATGHTSVCRSNTRSPSEVSSSTDILQTRRDRYSPPLFAPRSPSRSL